MSSRQVIYFGGISATESPSQFTTSLTNHFQILLHYLFTVWVNEYPTPTEPRDLRAFDLAFVFSAFDSHVAAGGAVDVGRGATLEETWLGLQLCLQQPLECLLNTEHPRQPSGRITRKALVSAADLIKVLSSLFPVRLDPKDDVRGQIQRWGSLAPMYFVLVFDGEVGHCLTFVGTDNKENFIYFDPQPERSMLCEENNQAGVMARLANERERYWLVPGNQLESVLHAVFRPATDRDG